MTDTIQTDVYIEFANGLLSKPSSDVDAFVAVVNGYKDKGINLASLMTAAIGIAGEAGEFADLVKKVAFQGKELDDVLRVKMVHELGDCFWYLAIAARSLGVSFDEILQENMNKLAHRYPNGFEVSKSENRCQ